MPRYKLIIEYDGSAYAGWQKQDALPSIQQALRHVPADVATYTSCVDLLRFAYATGSQVPVSHQTARLRMRCVGCALSAFPSVGPASVGM